jgi:hypothetical protein
MSEHTTKDIEARICMRMAQRRSPQRHQFIEGIASTCGTGLVSKIFRELDEPKKRPAPSKVGKRVKRQSSKRTSSSISHT